MVARVCVRRAQDHAPLFIPEEAAEGAACVAMPLNSLKIGNMYRICKPKSLSLNQSNFSLTITVIYNYQTESKNISIFRI